MSIKGPESIEGKYVTLGVEMSIKGPESIEGKSIKELTTLQKELSFQLRIVNSALKEHTRKVKFKKFFTEYPYYINNGKVIEINIDDVIAIEQAGFGYDKNGLPVWGESYGTDDEVFACIKDSSELSSRQKFTAIYKNIVELSNNKKENLDQKRERVSNILEGFDLQK